MEYSYFFVVSVFHGIFSGCLPSALVSLNLKDYRYRTFACLRTQYSYSYCFDQGGIVPYGPMYGYARFVFICQYLYELRARRVSDHFLINDQNHVHVDARDAYEYIKYMVFICGSDHFLINGKTTTTTVSELQSQMR